MKSTFCLSWAILAVYLSPSLAQDTSKKSITRKLQTLEGWPVQVDIRLLNGPDEPLGAEAQRVLGFKLYEIKKLLSKERVAQLQKTTIYLDLDYPLTSMQYHPSLAWLKKNGHDESLARSVHIPLAKLLASRFVLNEQPMAVLHELAHAYHDQVLGFDEPRIKEAWSNFKKDARFEKTLHLDGRPRRHYAMTNPMEFFAEMTEAYFGTNDFFPFVRSELKKELPDVYRLMEDVWGR